MSGYIIAGYTAAFGSLGIYGATLLARERAARRRLAPVPVRRRAPAPQRRFEVDPSSLAASSQPDKDGSEQ